MKKTMTVFVALLLGAALVTGCGGKKEGGSASAGSEVVNGITVSEWAKQNKLNIGTETQAEIYELAKKEGSVIVYAATSRIASVADSFMKQYPEIKVEAYDMNADQIYTKICTEYDAGIRNADLLLIKDIDGAIYRERVTPGHFINYYPSDISARMDPAFTKYTMPLYVELGDWFYNKELFPNGPPITSPWELTKPEWKNNLIIYDPIETITDQQTYSTIIQHADAMAADYQKVFGKPIVLSPECPTAGHEFIKRMMDNAVFGVSNEVVIGVGTSGQKEKKLGFSFSSKLRMNENNGLVLAPLTLDPPITISLPNVLYIVNECPHPNAAKLFLRWIVGEADGKSDGFKPFNTLGGWAVRDDVLPVAGNLPLSEKNFYIADPDYLYQHDEEVRDFLLSLRK
jgi:iron(III) transport system substrate-binding protein